MLFMKHVYILFLILLISSNLLYAQNDSGNKAIEAEVNEQLWKPFKKAFADRDWKQFNDLHTDDVLRVTVRGIRIGSEYKESVKRSYQREGAPKRTIDFWLEHRVYSGDTGYEVGYYEVTSVDSNNVTQKFYSRFHIVLKKVNGKWKIAQDWDTNNINGVPVTVEDYKKGTPLGRE